MKGAGSVAHMGQMRNAYNILVGKLKGGDQSGNQGTDGSIILE
jgi:hypothetical protein